MAIDISAGLIHKSRSHPSGKVTAFDEETGLPIVRREKSEISSTPVQKEAKTDEARTGGKSSNQDKREVATKKLADPDAAGRDVLHKSADRESLVRQAKDFARQFENGLKASTQGIKGARFESVRDEKTPTRLDEKIEKEGQPIETIPDILAGRIEADSHEAHEKTAAAVKGNFPVVRDLDEFKDGDPDFHYRAHKIQVQVTPELSGEVHIVPKEVLEAGFEQHADYQKARDADLAGDEKAEKKATGVARKINDEAMAAFEKRNAETEYKFGSTQANLPEDSDAHRAIRGAQAMVDKKDLAGDGTDIDKPHVTVRYGLKGDDHAGVKKYLGSQVPFEGKLGKTTTFPPSPNSDGASVVVAPVESDDLHRINGEIEKHGDFKKSDFPDYKPHVTVAYVKPEMAHKYEGMDVTEGKKFPVRSIAISNRDGEHEEVPLGGKMDADTKGGGGKSPEQSVAGSQDSANARKIKPEANDGNGSDSGGSPKSPSGVRANNRSAFQRRPSNDDDHAFAGPPRPADIGGKDVRPQVPESARVSSQREGAPTPKLARGVTVLVGDSHGIVRGGNPNFGSGGRWSVETPNGTKTLKGSELTPIQSAKEKDQPHVAVDLDKTLAEMKGPFKPGAIGKPIPEMVDRVKKMIADGEDVRIFTARVSDDPKGTERAAIEAWLHRSIGQALPITDRKTAQTTLILDDRARQVEPNTGKVVEA